MIRCPRGKVRYGYILWLVVNAESVVELPYLVVVPYSARLLDCWSVILVIVPEYPVELSRRRAMLEELPPFAPIFLKALIFKLPEDTPRSVLCRPIVALHRPLEHANSMRVIYPRYEKRLSCCAF